MSTELFSQYENELQKCREEFAVSKGIQFFKEATDKKAMHAFMIVWHGLGIKMTENVEHWIKNAGDACCEKGLEKVGKQLQRHAAQEANHDVMMREDFTYFVNKWNELYPEERLSEAQILALPTPQSVLDYIGLHEDTYTGENPFGQIAIEYEIEQLSVTHGPKMLSQPIKVLGKEFETGLSFLGHHVELDVGHTEYNRRLIKNCLESSESTLDGLMESGKKALSIYSHFLTDCQNLASSLPYANH